MKADTCPWWRAWWHARLRRVDREWMWPTVRRMARKLSPDDEEAAVLAALKVWVVFIQSEGQEHWRCPCSALDHEMLPGRK